jgi:hypothetical protein
MEGEMSKSLKILRLIFSMMLFTNSTYADQESMDEMVLSNIEFAVLNGIFTYDQLNQEPQILISSEFRRSSLKKTTFI